eukprot:384475_1
MPLTQSSMQPMTQLGSGVSSMSPGLAVGSTPHSAGMQPVSSMPFQPSMPVQLVSTMPSQPNMQFQPVSNMPMAPSGLQSPLFGSTSPPALWSSSNKPPTALHQQLNDLTMIQKFLNGVGGRQVSPRRISHKSPSRLPHTPPVTPAFHPGYGMPPMAPAVSMRPVTPAFQPGYGMPPMAPAVSMRPVTPAFQPGYGMPPMAPA